MRSKPMNSCAFGRSLVMVAALFFALAAGTPAFSAPEQEKDPQIRDVIVIEKRGRLLVFASLESAFSPELFDAINSGVATRFAFEVGLMQSRRFLFDTEVIARKLVHQVKYDALKKAFTFSVQREPDEVIRRVTQSRQEMVSWMAELNGAPIVRVRDLDPSGRYYLRVRAKVNSIDYAFPFNILLSFLERKTEWTTSPTFGAKGM